MDVFRFVAEIEVKYTPSDNRTQQFTAYCMDYGIAITGHTALEAFHKAVLILLKAQDSDRLDQQLRAAYSDSTP